MCMFWKSPQITKTSLCHFISGKNSQLEPEMSGFPTRPFQHTNHLQAFCHLWYQTPVPVALHSAPDNEGPLAWGLEGRSFPGRVRSSLVRAEWPRRISEGVWVTTIKDFGWRMQGRGVLVGRECVLVDGQKHFLVRFVFCFPVAVWEERQQGLVKLMSNWIKPEDLSVKLCVRRKIQGSNQSLWWPFFLALPLNLPQVPGCMLCYHKAPSCLHSGSSSASPPLPVIPALPTKTGREAMEAFLYPSI